MLFVDEAGQIALANAIAVSPAARSLVLLGDPQQLDQPLKGTHPPGAERSALAHLLDGAATMPADEGLFLAKTWRLHPDVCAFTSEVFYEGRLEPQAGPRAAGPRGRGAARRARASASCRSRTAATRASRPRRRRRSRRSSRRCVEGETWWTDRHGERAARRRSTTSSSSPPYNAQVGGDRAPAARGARVGTVDKFQGQQAADLDLLDGDARRPPTRRAAWSSSTA